MVFLITVGIYVLFNTFFVIFVETDVQDWNTYWEHPKSLLQG